MSEGDARSLLEVADLVKQQFRVNSYILGSHLSQRYAYSKRASGHGPQITLELWRYTSEAFSRLRAQSTGQLEKWKSIRQDEALRQRQQEMGQRRSSIDVVGLILETQTEFIYVAGDTQSKIETLVSVPMDQMKNGC